MRDSRDALSGYGHRTLRVTERSLNSKRRPAIVASGAVTVDHVSELLTPAQMDASTKMAASYRAPGK